MRKPDVVVAVVTALVGVVVVGGISLIVTSRDDRPVVPIQTLSACEVAFATLGAAVRGDLPTDVDDAEKDTLVKCEDVDRWLSSGLAESVRSGVAEMREYLGQLCDRPGTTDTAVCRDLSHSGTG